LRVADDAQNMDEKKPALRPASFRYFLAYWLAPEAGAAIAEDAAGAEAAASLAAGAEAAASLAAGAAEAAAGADAAASLAAGAAVSLLLLQAANAKAAIREATRRDFFMITSFYG